MVAWGEERERERKNVSRSIVRCWGGGVEEGRVARLRRKLVYHSMEDNEGVGDVDFVIGVGAKDGLFEVDAGRSAGG